MYGVSGPHRDYVELEGSTGDDTEAELIGLGIRPDEARRYVNKNELSEKVPESAPSFASVFFSRQNADA